VDLNKEGVIRAAEMHGKNNTNPFEGHRTTAQATATIVRGKVVMLDGELVGESGYGRMVRQPARAAAREAAVAGA
jgi:dihydroorotase